MRGEMKFKPRRGRYESSNVSFDPDFCWAYSYGWWRFVDKVNGKVIFNNYSYSQSTNKHQSKVRGLLRDLGIEIDFVVYSQAGLHSSGWKVHAVQTLTDSIEAVKSQLSNPRRHKKLDEERVLRLNQLEQEKAELVAFINTIQE